MLPLQVGLVVFLKLQLYRVYIMTTIFFLYYSPLRNTDLELEIMP
jgi:hypothetical protein